MSDFIPKAIAIGAVTGGLLGAMPAAASAEEAPTNVTAYANPGSNDSIDLESYQIREDDPVKCDPGPINVDVTILNAQIDTSAPIIEETGLLPCADVSLGGLGKVTVGVEESGEQVPGL